MSTLNIICMVCGCRGSSGSIGAQEVSMECLQQDAFKYLGNDPFTTKNGVVTLSGKAGNTSEKDLATKFAKDVNGVKSVKNQMTIG